MKTEEVILGNFKLEYPLERLAPLDQVLFLDIETTGFLAANSSLYLIGCAFYTEGNWVIRQWFAQTSEEEPELLKAFLDFAHNFSYLIHYNGNTFDLPYLKNKAKKYGIECDFDQLEGLDIYRRVAPYKNFLKLPNCKLKTVEEFLGIRREDGYTGGELIQVYHDYTASYDYNLYRTLLLHNSDDMKGMLEVLPILSYYDLFNCNLKARKVQANYYNDIHGIPRKELVLQLVFSSPLPVPISFMGRGCHFKGEGYEGTLIVPIYEEELKTIKIIIICLPRIWRSINQFLPLSTRITGSRQPQRTAIPVNSLFIFPSGRFLLSHFSSGNTRARIYSLSLPMTLKRTEIYFPGTQAIY